MASKTRTQVPPFSHSLLKMYENCPHRYYREKIVKDIKSDFSHPAAIWGNELHKALEEFIRDDTPLSERFRKFEPYALRLAQTHGDKHVEKKLAMHEDGAPAAFFDNSCYLRAVVDFLAIDGSRALMIDHKTGKVRPDEQLHRTAIVVFANFPEVTTIKAAFTWLQYEAVTTHHITRDELPTLHAKHLKPTVNQIRYSAENDAWPKKPSGLCPWCPVTDCEYFEG